MAVMNTAENVKYATFESAKTAPSVNCILEQIVERLKTENIYKIILFGSQAKGTSNADSDIDLVIIADDDFLSCDLSERFEHNRHIHKAIIDMKRKYPLDLRIYSRLEFKNAQTRGSLFINEIKETGKVIYERAN
jgi:predicted nucleotidyltransferase